MATVVADRSRKLSLAGISAVRVPLWQAVILSRLLVLAAGSASAILMHPLTGWQALDAERFSTALGPVGNVLTAAVVRWDGIAYLRIATHGYQSAASAVRFPLYPMLIGALTPLIGSAVVAGALISLSAFAVGMTLVHRLAREHLGQRVADTTLLLLAFAPWSFVFSADYTTSLMLLCVVATFYLARRDQFVLACVAAAAAAVTRVEGILLVAPLAVVFWRSRGGGFAPRRLWSPQALALALPPLALASFFAYTHARGWGWLAPITNQNMQHAGRQLVGPPVTVFESFKDTIFWVRASLEGRGPATAGFGLGPQNIVYLVVLALSLLGLYNAWRRLPLEYALFGLLAILVCTSSAVVGEPLKGFERYMLPIFPLWIGAAAWFSERRLTAAVMTLSGGMLIIETMQFVRWVSVF